MAIFEEHTISLSSLSGDSVTELNRLGVRLGELIGRVDASDLTGLAELHDLMGKVVTLAAETLDPARASAMNALATRGMQLLEQLVLNEVDDIGRSMGQIASSIAELQSFIDGTAKLEPIAHTASSAAHTPPAAAVALPGQCPLSEADLPLVQEFIGEATGHLESAEAGLLQLEENNSDADAINAVFRGFHTIKGVAGFLNLVQIGALAHAAENVLDLARKGKLQFDSAIADVILQSVDAMRKLIQLLAEIGKTGGTPAPLEGLNQLLTRLHDCAEGRSNTAPAPLAASPAAPAQASSQTQTPAPANESNKSQTVGDSTIKVSTDRLDALINMVGELVIAQAMVSQDMSGLAAHDRRVSRNLSHLGKITREMQELSMAMRMVPIQGVFQKMARLVRDLGRKAGKEIDLVTIGGETELDRNVVDAISDPLVHMVRNAADHGIESPDERLSAGKPRQGRLTLKACHQSGNIVIEISDDGRGLNKTKLVRKATDAGLIKPGQELSEDEIFHLIFQPGLSTAEKVTDISGRGVGMDVVKRNVESLRGRIDIASDEGRGSTFTIRLPLTLAVIDGLVVKVGPERYIIPISSIEQSIQPRPEQISTVRDRREMCMVRDRLVPVLRLHRVFGVKPVHEDPAAGLLVLVQSGACHCCLLVDQLLGQQQVVIKSLSQSLGQIKGVSGGAILGDGNVSLILDVPSLLNLASERNNADKSMQKEPS